MDLARSADSLCMLGKSADGCTVTGRKARRDAECERETQRASYICTNSGKKSNTFRSFLVHSGSLPDSFYDSYLSFSSFIHLLHSFLSWFLSPSFLAPLHDTWCSLDRLRDRWTDRLNLSLRKQDLSPKKKKS